MGSLFQRYGWCVSSVALTILISVIALASASGQVSDEDWKRAIQQQVRARNFTAAQAIVQERIVEAASDLDAHGWRARLLAWQGHWSEAESEYRFVLQLAPNDTDILIGLSDVILWQQRPAEALQIVDQARALQPNQAEILIRRARLLNNLGRTKEARAQFRQVLALDPSNAQAKAGTVRDPESAVHEIRFGTDTGIFNYTDAAQTYGVSFVSRWTKGWSTLFGLDFYDRFRQRATRFSGSSAYRFRARDWLNVGGAVARDNGVIPRSEAFFEYGHGFGFHKRWIHGLESSYQQRWLWFGDARVLTISSMQLFYLPNDWTWTFSATGARSAFSGTSRQWRPSGMTKLTFPLPRRVTGNTFCAVGSENYAVLDQIGSFSARTYGGGLRFRFTATQDVSGYVAYQDRSTGRTQTSYGVSYGIRF